MLAELVLHLLALGIDRRRSRGRHIVRHWNGERDLHLANPRTSTPLQFHDKFAGITGKPMRSLRWMLCLPEYRRLPAIVVLVEREPNIDHLMNGRRPNRPELN